MTRSQRTKPRPMSDAAMAVLKDRRVLHFRERRILELRNGLDGLGCRSLSEVAHEFEYTPQRISQLERNAIAKLEEVSNG